MVHFLAPYLGHLTLYNRKGVHTCRVSGAAGHGTRSAAGGAPRGRGTGGR